MFFISIHAKKVIRKRFAHFEARRLSGGKNSFLSCFDLEKSYFFTTYSFSVVVIGTKQCCKFLLASGFMKRDRAQADCTRKLDDS